MISIRLLLTEGKRMLEVAEQVPDRIDVYQAVCQIGRIGKVLEDDFNNAGFEDKMLKDIREFEFRYIQLEYYLMNYDSVASQRYQDRSLVTLAYAKTVEKLGGIKSARGERVMESELLDVVKSYSKVHELMEASKHLLFSLTKEEREYLDASLRLPGGGKGNRR